LFVSIKAVFAFGYALRKVRGIFFLVLAFHLNPKAGDCFTLENMERRKE